MKRFPESYMPWYRGNCYTALGEPYLLNLLYSSTVYALYSTAPTITHSNVDLLWNITDHRGVIRGIHQNAIPRGGLRMVKNLSPAEWNGTGWTSSVSGTGSITLSDSNKTATFYGETGSRIYRIFTFTAVVGRRYLLRTRVVSFSGSSTDWAIAPISGTTTASRSLAQTGNNVTYVSNEMTATGTTIVVHVGLGTAGTITGTATGVLDQIAVYDVTGEASTAVPHEYVDGSTNYGEGIVGLRYFNTTNGNSIDGSGVVTEGVGTVITGGYFAPRRSSTNLIPVSGTLPTGWTALTVISSAAATAPDGNSTAYLITETNANNESYTRAITGLTADTLSYTLSAYIKKTAALGYYPGIRVTLGANSARIKLNTETGAFTTYGTSVHTRVVAPLHSTTDFGDWWRLEVTVPNDGVATTASVFVHPAVSTTMDVGVSHAAAMGSTTFYGIQLEKLPYATPFINTTVAAVTRNGIAYTYANPIGSRTTFTLFMHYTPTAIDTLSRQTIFFLDDDGNDRFAVRLADVGTDKITVALGTGVGVATLVSTTSMVVGTTYKIAIVVTPTGSSLYVNGALEDTDTNNYVIATPATVQIAGNGTNANMYGVRIAKTAWTGAKAIAETTI